MGKYTVKSGDSWARIAGQMYGGDQRYYNVLMSANKGITMLKPGMVIEIPDLKDYMRQNKEAGRLHYVGPDDIAQANLYNYASGYAGEMAFKPGTAPAPWLEYQLYQRGLTSRGYYAGVTESGDTTQAEQQTSSYRTSARTPGRQGRESRREVNQQVEDLQRRSGGRRIGKSGVSKPGYLSRAVDEYAPWLRDVGEGVGRAFTETGKAITTIGQTFYKPLEIADQRFNNAYNAATDPSYRRPRPGVQATGPTSRPNRRGRGGSTMQPTPETVTSYRGRGPGVTRRNPLQSSYLNPEIFPTWDELAAAGDWPRRQQGKVDLGKGGVGNTWNGEWQVGNYSPYEWKPSPPSSGGYGGRPRPRPARPAVRASALPRIGAANRYPTDPNTGRANGGVFDSVRRQPSYSRGEPLYRAFVGAVNWRLF